jgi:glycosyltransferase 2 family protein
MSTIPPDQEKEFGAVAGSTNAPESGVINVALIRKRVLSLPTLLAISIGAALLIFALWRVFDFEWDEVWTNIKNVDPAKYLVALALYYLSFWFRGLRWHQIAKTANIGGDNGKHVPKTLTLSGIILMGWFANSVAFLRLGDAYRGWALAKEAKGDFPSSLGTVFAERVQDMAAVLILVLVAAIWVTTQGNYEVPVWIIIAAATLVVAPVIGLLVMRKAGERISRRLPARFEKTYLNFQSGTLESFSGRGIPPQLALGIIGWLLEIARFYFVADALGIELSLGVVMFAALANAMLTTIPTPGGFGFVEGGLTGLLTFTFKISHNDAIALVAVDRTISWLSVVFFGGILFVVWHAVKAKKSTSTSSAVPE